MNLPEGMTPENLMEGGKLNPFIKNLFFTALEGQTEDAVKKLKIDAGRLTEIIYILEGKNEIHKQRLYFSKIPFVPKRDEVQITDKEVQGFLTTIGIDWMKEKKDIKFIFVKLNFKTQDISYEQHNNNGSKKHTTL